MEGYLNLRINPWVRRLLTRLLAIVPALIVIIIYGEEKVNSLLVLSQVVLSLQLGFAIIPLIHFVSDKKTMGDFVIKPITKITAWLIAGILIFLNLKMLINEAASAWVDVTIFSKIGLVILGIISIALLFYTLLFPLFKTAPKTSSIEMHPDIEEINQLVIPEFKVIAIALDFSEKDQKLIAFAIGQGKENTRYILVHVVESASAKLLGTDSDDYETRKDKERMDWYVNQLQQLGYAAEGHLGFRNRAKEIVRIVKELNADMLVAGAHGHTGLKDFIYGETVNTVRHELKIPVLIVNV